MKQFRIGLLFSSLYCLSIPAIAQNNYSVFNQKIPVAAYAGKNFRLTAAVKSNDNENSFALLLVSVERKDKLPGFSDNMLNRPVKTIE